MNVLGMNSLESIKDTLPLAGSGEEGKAFEESFQKAIDQQDHKKLKEACEQVETYMITSIFKQMKKSTEMGERLIPKGDYEEMFEDYMIEEQCKYLTQAGGIGLADMMYKQMSTGTQAPTQVDTGV